MLRGECRHDAGIGCGSVAIQQTSVGQDDVTNTDPENRRVRSGMGADPVEHHTIALGGVPGHPWNDNEVGVRTNLRRIFGIREVRNEIQSRGPPLLTHQR